MRNRISVMMISALLLAAPPALAREPDAAAEQGVQSLCATPLVSIHTDFPGAPASRCMIEAEDKLVILITPERPLPINPSPWYGFRYQLSSPANGEARPIRVEMRYMGGEHRYEPKVSSDGQHWQKLAFDRVTLSQDAQQGEGQDDTEAAQKPRETIAFTLPADGQYISAQENLQQDFYTALRDDMVREHGARVEAIGTSHDGRTIEALLLGNPKAKKLIVLVGRQHPPEVTGALAMDPFMRSFFAEFVQDKKLSSQYQILAVPLLNVDGVARGHWRTNMGGIDLNRDWGPFTQPETRAVRDYLNSMEQKTGARPVLMLDFHSTYRNLFYIQGEDQQTSMPDLVHEWLEKAKPDLPDYPFTLEPSTPQPTSGTTKNWFNRTYGIPAITYEMGDESDRKSIDHSARYLAKRLARILRKQK